MSNTNAELELMGKGLAMLQTVLLTFVNSKMTKQYGDEWLNNNMSVRNILKRSNPNQIEYSLDDLDISLLLNIIDNNNIWEDAFNQTLVNTTILTSIHQSQLVSFRNIRNRYAHPCVANIFSLDEVEETLFKMQNIVEVISPDDVDSFRNLRQGVSYLRNETGSSKVGIDLQNNNETSEAPHLGDETGSSEVDTSTQNINETPEAPHLGNETSLNQPSTKINNPNPHTESDHKPQELKPDIPTKKIYTVNSIAKLSLTIIAMFGLGVVVAIKSFQSFSVNNASISPTINSTEKIPKYGLQSKSLKIGILGNPKNYNELESHLRSQFGNNIQIKIDGDSSISYTEARNRIIRKEWDIAFTLSPMLSVAAKDNGYTHVAQMFPGNPLYYQAALFVKFNSSIKSLNDLKPSHTIALGDFNSASSFYMPAYDLFGKTLRVDEGHSSQNIVKMVENGKADVGAAALSRIENTNSLRIIHLSRKIPGSGVYLSPNISESDREVIKKALLDAPSNIQKQANYGAGEEPDYSTFVKLSQKSEEVLKCADFQSNPVNFYCTTSASKQNASGLNTDSTIVGKINGWSKQDSETEKFRLSAGNKIYLLLISRQTLSQIPGASNPIALQKKDVRVSGVVPKQLDSNTFEVRITQPEQLIIN